MGARFGSFAANAARFAEGKDYTSACFAARLTGDGEAHSGGGGVVGSLCIDNSAVVRGGIFFETGADGDGIFAAAVAPSPLEVAGVG